MERRAFFAQLLGRDDQDVEIHMDLVAALDKVLGGPGGVTSSVEEGIDRSRYEKLLLAMTAYVVRSLATPGATMRKDRKPLGEILAAAELPYVDFLQYFRDILQRCEPVLTAKFHVGAKSLLERNAQQLCDRFFFTAAWKGLAQKKLHNYLRAPEGVSELAWLMFITLRSNDVASLQNDQMRSCILMVCVINLVLANAPATLCRFAPGNAGELLRVAAPDGRADSLLSLCQDLGLGEATSTECKELMPWVEDSVAAALSEARGAQVARVESAHAAHVDTSCGALEGLVGADGDCAASVAALDRLYADTYMAAGELDERLLWRDTGRKVGAAAAGATPRAGALHRVPAEALATPFRGIDRGAAVFLSGGLPGRGARADDAAPAGALSPLRSPAATALHASHVPQTPITAAIRSDSWLTKLLEGAPDPSVAPPAFLVEALGEARAAGVVRAAASLVARAFEDAADVPGEARGARPALFQDMRESRPRCATKLVFFVIGRMVQLNAGAGASADQRRSLVRQLTGEANLVGLVALSCDVVCHASHILHLRFPKSLEKLGITAFDVYKLIQPFRRALDVGNMPGDMTQHILRLLISIVEEHAWTPGSSFYLNLYLAVHGALPPDARTPGREANNGSGSPRSTAEEAGATANPEHASIMATQTVETHGDGSEASGGDENAHPAAGQHMVVRRPGGGAVRLPSLPTTLDLRGGGEAAEHNTARKVLEQFFRDVLKRAQERLSALVDRLPEASLGPPQQREEAKKLVMRLVTTALTDHLELFFNRHIDQVLLCALYGVSKVHRGFGAGPNGEGLKFKCIVDAYGKIPNVRGGVYRQVVQWQDPVSLAVRERNDIIKFYNKVFMPALKSQLLAMRDQAPAGSHPAVPPAQTSPDEAVSGQVPPARAQTRGTAAADADVTPPSSPARPAAGYASPWGGAPLPVVRSPQRATGVWVSPMRAVAARGGSASEGGASGAPPATVQPGTGPVILLDQPSRAFQTRSNELQGANEQILRDGGAPASPEGERRRPKKHRVA
ncbi:unnamed protein product [Pedinophyceae sp. YPF-701]|nr:unnamed protein product [Pedinophyceae sp. YPF-701]